MVLEALRSLALRVLQLAHHHRGAGLIDEVIRERIVAGDDAGYAALQCLAPDNLHRPRFGQFGLQRDAVAVYVIRTGHDVVGAQVRADIVELDLAALKSGGREPRDDVDFR